MPKRKLGLETFQVRGFTTFARRRLLDGGGGVGEPIELGPSKKKKIKSPRTLTYGIGNKKHQGDAKDLSQPGEKGGRGPKKGGEKRDEKWIQPSRIKGITLRVTKNVVPKHWTSRAQRIW